MIKPISKQKQALIVNSVKRVFENSDINYLTKTAYDYLYLCSGFIAHYNHGGFMCTYEDILTLANDIYTNYQQNRWMNFHPGDRDYEYMMSKAQVYKRLYDLAKSYLNTAIVNA